MIEVFLHAQIQPLEVFPRCASHLIMYAHIESARRTLRLTGIIVGLRHLQELRQLHHLLKRQYLSIYKQENY